MTKTESFKDWWPAWFPYPRNWVRAFATAMLMGLVGVSVRLTGFWGLVISSTTDRILPWIVLSCLGLLAPFLLVAYAHNMIWGKSPTRWPQWLPSPSSLKEGLTALIVMFVAIIIGLVALLPFAECFIYAGEFECRPLTEGEVNFATAVWFISAAYLYQYDYLVRRRRVNKQKRSVAPRSTTAAPSNPVDIELNQLRGDLGLHHVKKTSKQKPQ